MGQLTGRAAIVTGAGDGIGRAIARRYAQEGASVVIAELDESTGRGAAQAIREETGSVVEFLRTDVKRKEDVLAMVNTAVQRFGRLDILVNNAWGGGSTCRVELKTDADLQHGLDMNLWAGFWAMQAAFPHMRAQQWGRVINICSLNGVNAHMGTLEYNVSKEALRTLTRTAAREWARHQICCNVICPGAATAAYKRFRERSPQMADAIAAANPMGRVGDPDTDIAGVALFLASDDCRYVTGNTLYADGGGHINGVAWAPELPETR